MLLTKQQILSKRFKTETIKLEDGGEIIVRALPMHVVERQKGIADETYGADAFVFVNAVVDQNGSRLYTDAEAAEIAATVDSGLIGLVVSKAFLLSQVDPATQEQIKKNWNTLGVSLFGESPSPSDTPTPT